MGWWDSGCASFIVVFFFNSALVQIRLFNFGGDIFGDSRKAESFFHFVGVLIYSSDRE